MNSFTNRLDDQFKATVLWNKMVDLLCTQVQTKSHKRKLRLYKNSFVAQKAVDCLFDLLKADAELSDKVFKRDQVVNLFATFLRLGIIQKVSSSGKQSEFKDNRDLYRIVQQEKENQTNRTIENDSMQVSKIICDEEVNNCGNPKAVGSSGSMNHSYLMATEMINQTVQIDKKVFCLGCAVETDGNHILKFLHKISSNKLTNSANSQKYSIASRHKRTLDEMELSSQELRSKSFQILSGNMMRSFVNEPSRFSKNNPLYKTMGSARCNVKSAHTTNHQTRIESIYAQVTPTLPAGALLQNGQKKFHQQSFNTLV